MGIAIDACYKLFNCEQNEKLDFSHFVTLNGITDSKQEGGGGGFGNEDVLGGFFQKINEQGAFIRYSRVTSFVGKCVFDLHH